MAGARGSPEGARRADVTGGDSTAARFSLPNSNHRVVLALDEGLVIHQLGDL